MDVARITQIMDETRRQGSNLKWTVYYEDEEDFNYPVSRLVEDLNYLKKWFAWHPTFAHKDGKPVIFVWNEGNCEVASRWAAASKQAGWYVVLKLFRQYRSCPFYGEIDSWHQYVSNRSRRERMGTPPSVRHAVVESNVELTVFGRIRYAS